MQKKFWKNKHIIITGSGGFVGSHLKEFLIRSGAHVVGITRHPRGNTGEIAIDTTEFSALESIVKRTQPDVFFHLASDAIVETGQIDPYKTFHNNIVSALNVLEIGRKLAIHRIIMASTVHVYGNSRVPYVEHEPARPSRPYETSKTATDLIAQSYADTFDLPVLIPRFVNIYGPGDRSNTRIVPKTIRTVLAGSRPTLWGGEATRDYLYIDDAIAAYDLLGSVPDAKVEKNRIFNFATGSPVTARYLIGQIQHLIGVNHGVEKQDHIRPNEVLHQQASFEKAKEVLGWKPNVTLSEGLAKTIAWYRNEVGEV